MSPAAWALGARWLWCGPGDLRPGGWVVMRGGRVEEIFARRPPGMPARDLGSALLMPGLVNAHTHLELSFLAGLAAPQGDFVEWLLRLVALRPGHDQDQALALAIRAAGQAAQSGTVLAGDITNTGRARSAWLAAGVSAISFWEALGPVRAEPPEEDLAWQGPLLQGLAMAAHAPYSVPAARLQALKQRARALPFCLHMAESQAEMELFAGQGEQGRLLDQFLAARGLLRSQLGLIADRPLAHVLALGVVDGRTLLVHGVQLAGEELSALAQTGASLCVCPRSNLGLTGRLARVEKLASLGVNLALGTDSLASAPDLRLGAEMAVLHRQLPGLAPERILAMATLGGARALGQEQHFGRLAPGQSGHPAWVALPQVGKNEVLEAALERASDIQGSVGIVEDGIREGV